MTTLNPKQEFQLFEKQSAADLKAHREDPWLKLSCCFAISEMAVNGATAEKLAGAREFVITLLNLWSQRAPGMELPRKSLVMDAATPATEKAKP